MKIEQEIMEMFDKEFNRLYDIDNILMPRLKSFISHIITLVQKREREEMVEVIHKTWNYPCTCDKESLYNQKTKECLHNFSQMHSIINLIKTK